MDKNDIFKGLAIAGSLALVTIATYYQSRIRNDNDLSYAQKERLIASEKTTALTKLFETDAFKTSDSFEQKRLIEAIERLYT